MISLGSSQDVQVTQSPHFRKDGMSMSPRSFFASDLFSVFRKKQDDPNTSFQAAKRWVSSLPLEDEYEAHRMIVNALSLFNASKEPLNRERLKVLIRLDESSYPLQQSLCDHYMRNRKTLKNMEKTLWKGIFALYWHFAHGYQAFIKHILTNEGAKSELKSFLPHITTRAIHYFGMEMKWRYFHQEGVDSNMWRRLNKLYRISESLRFNHTKIKLHGAMRLTTCADEYVRSMLLNLLNPTSLSAEQIEILDSWLMRWTKLVTLDLVFDANKHTHYVDLSQGAGAFRVSQGAQGGEKNRYWSIKEIVAQLDKVRSDLRAGVLPEKLELPIDCRLPMCLDLLDQVSALWSQSGAARILPSETGRQAVNVACGMAAIYECLKENSPNLPGTGENLDYRNHAHWMFENEGEEGFGLKIETTGCEDAAIDNLVGVKTMSGNSSWEIGAVRWMTHSVSDKFCIGVEKFSHSPRLVELSAAGNEFSATQNPSNSDKAPQSTEAIFLPKVDRHGMASSLIMPDTAFSASGMLDLLDKNAVYRIRLTNVLENSQGWIRVRFDVLSRTGG